MRRLYTGGKPAAAALAFASATVLFLGAFFARLAFAVPFGLGAAGAVCTVEDVDDDAGAGVALGGGRLTETCKPCALHLSSWHYLTGGLIRHRSPRICCILLRHLCGLIILRPRCRRRR